jgi:signal transduction histidine kinase
MLRTIYKLEHMGTVALAREVATIRQEFGIRIYLVTPSDTGLNGRNPSDEVIEIARASREAQHRVAQKTSKGRLIAHPIYRQDHGALTAVFRFPVKRRVIVDLLSASLWLRVLLAVLISGAICFGLSKLMTNRLKDLQMASRHLANGDLNTRLQVRERGGDETDELGRDFNSMAEQLQERIQSQKRLLGDVSHELRSPLARLRMALALAQKKPNSAPQYMERIEREAERLEDLVGQLLASQEQDIQLDTHIDLVSLLTELCSDANFEGQVANKKLVFSSDTDPAIVSSCGDLLRKSFENVMRNALHHTSPNSEVTVSLSSSDNYYLISIEDQGTGVPDEELRDIFKEFYRVDTARTRESGGFGLGLAIARRAILQHGGEITAQNISSGLKIVVRLPCTRLAVPLPIEQRFE